MQQLNPRDHEHYMSMFSGTTQKYLKDLHATIVKALPKATQTISYQMPCFKTTENLVYFAAFKNHISFFPTSSPILHFADLLVDYKTSKGTIHLPLDQPIPKSLITAICKFRAEQAEVKASAKKEKKTCKQGHTYYKSSSCPTCPQCDAMAKIKSPFASLSSPAARALNAAGIKTVKELSKWSEAQLLQLHGLGKSSIPILQALLQEHKLKMK